MMHLAFILAEELARCAPSVSPKTMAAIIHVESGGDPLAIGDNTTARAYHPRDRARAEAIARDLLRKGHSVDLGIAQIDDVNFERLGLTVENVFDACTNLSAAARVLGEDYRAAIRYFGTGQTALQRAIGMYNTGRLDAGFGYARRVLAAAGVSFRTIIESGADRERAARAASFLIYLIGNRKPKLTVSAPDPSRAPIIVTLHLRRVVGI